MSVSSSRVLRFPGNETRLFGKYTLIAKLGQGGMADVFLAMFRGPGGFNKLVVIKRLKPDMGEDPEFKQMFLDEGKLAARLNHANIVQANEVGEVEGHQYIAMEYLDGQPLNRIVVRAFKQVEVPQSVLLRVVSDTLCGLHYAHELADFDGTPLGVVHRDVSPHNVFVTYDGQVKVVDFGIAKAATRTQNTSTGVVKGKISYMAPEQALCTPVDRRADVFSVGLILWELVAKRRFWGDLSEVQILKKMAFGDVPSLQEVAVDVDPELSRIVGKALAMVPSDRYESAMAFKRELDAYMVASNSHASSANLGDCVGKLFADRREEVKLLIQERLSTTTILSGNDALPVLDMNPDGTLPPHGVRAGSGRSRPLIDDPPSTSGIINTEAPALTASGASSMTGPVYAAGALAPSKKRSFTVPLAMVGGVVVIAAALFVGFRVGGAPESAPQRPEQVVPPDGLITVTIRAEPTEAAIFIDGAEVAANPFSARFPSDGKAHTVRVEAEGHIPHTQMLVFEKDLNLPIRLAVAGEPAPEPSATATPTASAVVESPTVPGLPPPTTKWPRNPTPPPAVTGQSTGSKTGTKTGNELEKTPWGKK